MDLCYSSPTGAGNDSSQVPGVLNGEGNFYLWGQEDVGHRLRGLQGLEGE